MKFSSKKLKFVILTTLAITLGSFSFSYAQELPQDPEVVNADPSEYSFDYSVPDTLTISTSLENLIINFSSYNICANQTVNYNLPNSAATVLNRVTGNSISNIFGTLNANGNIFLINPNGINFGASANINVASLVASTLDISNQDFLSANYKFFKVGENGFIVNEGNIAVGNGGYVCLLSGAIKNEGAIVADLGTIVLASGEATTLALDDLNDISVVIDEAVKDEVLGLNGEKMTCAIENSGTIQANGGKVILTAKVLDKVFDYAVNNSGVIQAKATVDANGVIEFVAEGAPVYNIGKVEAAEVTITTDSEFINKDEIIANGTAEFPDGGRVAIEAGSVLQQGLISANAALYGTAGEISIISSGTATLDGSSTTEARALGLVGNGGRILISSNGNTYVDINAVIDVSAGVIAGNAGYIEVSALDQLGFYGILNGRAPPGFLSATVIFRNNPSEPEPTVDSDKEDYQRTEKPIISGFGYSPNTEITVRIVDPNGSIDTLKVLTDSEGNFVLYYTPESLRFGTYFVTSTDGEKSAVTTFTDKNVIIAIDETASWGELIGDDTAIISIVIINDSDWGHNVASAEIQLQDITDAMGGGNVVGTWGSVDSTLVAVTGSGIIGSAWGVVSTAGNGYLAIAAPSNTSDYALDPGETMVVTFQVALASLVPSSEYYTKIDVVAYHNSQLNGAKFDVKSPEADIIRLGPPVGSIIIDDIPPYDDNVGATYTNDQEGDVLLHLSVNVVDGIIVSYRLADGTDASAGTEVLIPGDVSSYDDYIPWQLPVGDGTKFVAVQYKIQYTVGSGAIRIANYSDYIILDTVAPDINILLNPAGPDGLNGWCISDVSTSATAIDPISLGVDVVSGLDNSTFQYSYNNTDWFTYEPGVTAVPITTESDNSPVYYHVYDNAGNLGNATESIKLDKTPPTINAGINPAAPDGLNGWYVANPTVSYVVVESGSGIDVGNSDYADDYMLDGSNQTATGFVQDMAGWYAEDSITNINVDTIAPTINASRDPLPNINGWNNNDVTVSYVVSDTDGLSGIDAAASDYADDVVSVEGSSQSVSGYVYDLAGNYAEAVITDINIDKTAPTLIWGLIDPAPNAVGWNNTIPVNIPYTANDNLSGVDTSIPLSPVTFSAQGAGQTQDVTVTDLAGNSATFTSPAVNIDTIAPVVDITNPTDGRTYTDPQTLDYTVTDNIDPNPVLTGPTSGTRYDSFGLYAVTITATDFAGNSASGTVNFEIIRIPVYPIIQDYFMYMYPPLEMLLGDTGVQATPYDTMSSEQLAHSTYFYHPLTPADITAFDQFILDEGAYEFIDNVISIRGGHNALLSVLEELKKKKKAPTL